MWGVTISCQILKLKELIGKHTQHIPHQQKPQYMYLELVPLSWMLFSEEPEKSNGQEIDAKQHKLAI